MNKQDKIKLLDRVLRLLDDDGKEPLCQPSEQEGKQVATEALKKWTKAMNDLAQYRDTIEVKDREIFRLKGISDNKSKRIKHLITENSTIDSIIGKLEHTIEVKDNAIREQEEQVSELLATDSNTDKIFKRHYTPNVHLDFEDSRVGRVCTRFKGDDKVKTNGKIIAILNVLDLGYYLIEDNDRTTCVEKFYKVGMG